MARGDEAWAAARARMVDDQLVARGIRDARVLRAMGAVPRERFVPEAVRARAYDDGALPIGGGQTISQPYMVARSCELLDLRGAERVLEIGGGSGYQAAVLAELVDGEVVTAEIVPALARQAAAALGAVAGPRVRVVEGDGLAVARDEGPFDRIVVAAGAEDLPDTLIEALAPGGVLVAPVGPRELQHLLRVERRPDGELRVERHEGCVFVPLVSTL